MLAEGRFAVLTRRDLLMAAVIGEERKFDDVKQTEKLIGSWSKLGCFGAVYRWRGWPLSFVIAYQRPNQLHQATILQWGELPEVGNTNALLATMATFLKGLPPTITSAVMVADDRSLDCHQNLKAMGFSCVKVLRNHFRVAGADGYLFIKHLREKPTEEDEGEEECLSG